LDESGDKMNKLLIVLLVLFSACSDDSSEKYHLGFEDGYEKGFRRADSISKSSITEKEKEFAEKTKAQFELGFQRAFYLNNNLIKMRLELTDDEFWRLVAEIYYTKDSHGVGSKPISSYFESVSFLPEKNYRNIYSFRENLMKTYSARRLAPEKHKNNFNNNFFVPADTIRIPNSNKFIVPMHGYGFESKPYVLSLFTIDNGKYTFKGVLDSCFSTSIGSLGITEIIALNPFKHILIGQSGGGDGGDHWGSLWIVPFNNFLKLGNKKAFRYSYNMDENRKKIDYSVNKRTNEVYVNTHTKKILSGETENYTYADWEITKSDTIKLNDF